MRIARVMSLLLVCNMIFPLFIPQEEGEAVAGDSEEGQVE